MKIKNSLIILSLLMISILCIGVVSAVEDNNVNNNSLELLDSDESSGNVLESSNDGQILSASKTIYVDEVGENHREMNDHTIRDAINSANAGDTIIINGASYDHVHIVIDKQLTIKSNVGTNLRHCSNSGTSDSGHQGIFYITSKASGTVIEGFNFLNDDGMLYDNEGYSIYINGASNVVVKNCNISNGGVGKGIIVKNADNTLIQNNNILNAQYGIDIIDSTKTTVNYNDIDKNKVTGISISGSSSNPTISFNNITNNKNGIELTSSDNINILSNYIATNTNHGVYVNCKITKINIIGNFFYKNTQEEVFNDVNTKGLFVNGGEKLEVINNNYFVGLDNRPVQRADSVGGGVFLGYAFEINTNVACPIIYFKYGSEKWFEGNYQLKLSEITQSKKGIYSISIVDANGNVAKGLSSVPVTFYLNKNNNYVSPQEGDVYKTVIMVDGTATVRFYPDDFNESGNIVTAVLPGYGNYLTSDQGKNVKTFNVDDEYIPGNVTASKIIISNLNTYPNSNVNYKITLKDIYNNPIVGETVIFNINSKNIKAVTNTKGEASVKINQKVGTYTVKVTYVGDDIDYGPSNAKATVKVNKISTKIVASNYAMFIKKATYYKITLKDANGQLLSSQKVTIKVNKKTYKLKTNSKGVVKVKLKLKKGRYKVQITYGGSDKYLAAKKTTKITVKKTLKTKLTAPKITTTPKTSTKYSVTLKDENGDVIKKQNVVVKVNGKTYSKKTNGKGQVTISVKFSKLKSYNVKATFKGNKLYKKSSKTGKITVKKLNTVINAPNINTNPNTQNNYIVTLKTSNGKVIPKQTLKITLNGKSYTKTTNANGQVIIQTSFADENTYKANVVYAGNTIYKNSNAIGTIKVSRLSTQLISYDRTFSKCSSENYIITLKDSSENGLNNQLITYTLNNQSYSQNTDDNGQIKINFSSLNEGSYKLSLNYAQTNKYRASNSNSVITISNKTGVTFVDANLPNDEIQNILDNTDNPVEFLATTYNDISLSINKLLNITFKENTTLNGKSKSPVLTITVSNFNISNLIINANEGSGILVQNANNITIENNVISNMLDQSKTNMYNSGEISIPGNGIGLTNVNNIKINDNDIKSFGNAIFAQNNNLIEIKNNNLSLSNYGINYGLDVKNTNISNNLITKNIGLYVMDVPEGPLGYGIFLNQSAVNVTITENNISDNYMGISIDSNYSTGIVIIKNLICDNALEGIRFNAGYDLAENAVEPNVNDNAIYRNAKGPSMMILGELSANPGGIYHYGEFNETKRLQLGANWYGKNARVTWDDKTNTTGYGTMCPRINTTYISVSDINVITPGTYSITFYKYSEVASNLPVFEMYATLNDGSEIKFNVVNGVGTFIFDASMFNMDVNVIKISIGSLNDQYRNFEVLLNKTLDVSEIPTE